MQAVSQKYDLGQIENHFGLLDEKKRSVVPERLRDFLVPVMSVQDVSEKLKVGRGTMYKETLLLKNQWIKERIVPLVIAADWACDLFSDNEKAREWMLAPNAYFFGDSPVDVCLMGDGRGVLELLQSRSGRTTPSKGRVP